MVVFICCVTIACQIIALPQGSASQVPAPLTVVVMLPGCVLHFQVPVVLTCCARLIEEEGIVDGIYRLSGVSSNIQKLRAEFDEEQEPNLTADDYLQDIHSISSLLKMYFRELPNPLFTYQLYDKFAVRFFKCFCMK